MMVYIVTELTSHDGEREIKGAFTTRATAQAWIDKQTDSVMFDIEEVPLESVVQP